MADFKIASFNCKHFSGQLKKNYISDVFKKCDILMLQEHWLHEENFESAFSSLDNNISVCMQGKSAMPSNVVLNGRPHGGCVILWRSNLKYSIIPIDTISVRLNCIKINVCENYSILLFNVYMPCDDRSSHGNINEFQDILSEISVIATNENVDNLIIGGDFNTSFDRQSPQSEELRTFCNSEELFPCCKLSVSKVEYTYECLYNGARTHIDHILVSESLKDTVVKYYPEENIDNMSDHLVIFSEFNILCEYLNMNNCRGKTRPNWYKATIHDIDAYKTALRYELSNIVIPHGAYSCRDLLCDVHYHDIECLHEDIVNACLKASDVLPSTGNSNVCGKRPHMPGWNDYCAPKKEIALMCHWKWKRAGCPRTGALADMRRKSRSEYHYAVRKCQKQCNLLKSKKMAECMMQNDVKGYWNEIRKIKSSSKKIPSMVDNVTGDDNIAGIFAEKFSNLYNCVNYNKTTIDGISVNVHNKLSLDGLAQSVFNIDELSTSVKNLSLSKSDGNAGVFSNHIIYGREILSEYLLILFNCMIIHGYSPRQMNVGTMIPIPKGKRPNITKSENFRGICLQSMFCKLLDHLIFLREKKTLVTSNLQFGFKPKLSASHATAVVTETVDYYLDRGGSVYTLALDASKAFDRVEYVKLFQHLIDRGVNPFYVRILLNMYLNQQIRVSFNNTMSNYFNVTNGVKQGGVLSPTLYSIYIDDMLNELEKSGYGCCVGEIYSGSVAYADDLLLLSPTLYGLKMMVKICEIYAKDHSIIFNGKKSKLMRFSKNLSCDYIDIYVNNEKVVKVDSMDYFCHTLFADRNNNMLDGIVKEFNVKANTVIGTFNPLSSQIKNDLLSKYCTSFYGCNLSALYDRNGINQLCVNYRKVLRRIWNLSWRTHCRLLPHVSNTLPLEVSLQKRFVNFFKSGYNSNNSVLNFIFKHAIKSYSRIGRNLRYINYKYNLDCINQYQFIDNDCSANVIKSWNNDVTDESIRIGSQIREIVFMRDSFEPWLLENNECQAIIDLLCEQ